MAEDIDRKRSNEFWPSHMGTHSSEVKAAPDNGLSKSNEPVGLDNAMSPSQTGATPEGVPNILTLKQPPGLKTAASPFQRRSSSMVADRQEHTPPRSPVSRRSSSQFSPMSKAPSTVRSNPPISASEAPPKLNTAASIAAECFGRELANLHNSAEAPATQTVVILQDDCFRHRFSRPRTSKSALGTIVERPERMHASILGVAAAYVRLGGRHSGGSAPLRPQHEYALPSGVPFKIHKTARRLSLQSPATNNTHGAHWMQQLITMCNVAETKLAMGAKELSRPSESSDAANSQAIDQTPLHEGDLYLCSGSLAALEGALGGVCEAVDAVFGEKGPHKAFVCIRPPGHHCSANMPSGFCWVNNVHVGINYAAMTHGLTHAAIIDFDLHHGDGSQAMTWAHNKRVASLPKNTPMTRKAAIGYFSLHDINSYPCEMGDDEKIRNASVCVENAHGQSIWNVHLQPWKTEAEFWALYEDKYLVVLAKARCFLRAYSERLQQSPTRPKPKAAIFISAGFDASEWESPYMQRHQVNVPTSFYARFTRDVTSMADEESLGVHGRIVSVLEGGYSDRALMSGVLGHICGLTSTPQSSRPSSSTNGLGADIGQRMGQLGIEAVKNAHDIRKVPEAQELKLDDSEWWSASCLENLEGTVDPSKARVLLNKSTKEGQPTYASTTESYTAKIIQPCYERRSVSSSSLFAHRRMSAEVSQASLTIPEVDWTVATHELSKLLIPNDRETRSCKPEELNAEASRIRRDIQVGAPSVENILPEPKRMPLREKRSKPIAATGDDKLVPSRASRRKTIADATLLERIPDVEALPPLPHPGIPSKVTRRRSSTASISSLNTDRPNDFKMAPLVEPQDTKPGNFMRKPKSTAVARVESTKPKASKRPIPTAVVPGGNTYEESVGKFTTSSDSDRINVDQISSGMRHMSIKLKVPSKEEYEARQAKTKPAPRGRPPKSQAAKAGKASSPSKGRSTINGSGKVTSPSKSKIRMDNGATPNTDIDMTQAMRPTVTNAPTLSPEELSAFDAPRVTPFLPTCPDPTKIIVPVHAVNPMLPMTDLPPLPKVESGAHDNNQLPPLPPSSPLTGSGPAYDTPVTARRTKQDLPVFTSTTPIAFGNVPATSASSSISGHSANPRAIDPGPNVMGPPLVPSTTNTSMRRLAAPNEQHKSDDDSKLDPIPDSASPKHDIWDIPDTPQTRKS